MQAPLARKMLLSFTEVNIVLLELLKPIWSEILKFTFVEEKAKAPDVAWSANMDLIALASIVSPKQEVPET